MGVHHSTFYRWRAHVEGHDRLLDHVEGEEGGEAGPPVEQEVARQKTFGRHGVAAG